MQNPLKILPQSRCKIEPSVSSDHETGVRGHAAEDVGYPLWEDALFSSIAKVGVQTFGSEVVRSEKNFIFKEWFRKENNKEKGYQQDVYGILVFLWNPW